MGTTVTADVDTMATLIAAVLANHYYAGGWCWRYNWKGEDIPGRWSCGCGAYGTPQRHRGALVDAHRRHVGTAIAEMLDVVT